MAAEGIRLDIGHGAASFDFGVARRAIADGLKPWSISTDLHLHNIDGPVHDMATTMAKLLAVGLPLDEVIPAVTERPRGFLGLGSAFTPGLKADFTVFDVVDHGENATDSMGNTLMLDRMIEPRHSVIGADIAPAARRVGARA
jgi:dihydroorotase